MSLQKQIDQLKTELSETQKIRAGHWDKYQLSHITENIVRELLRDNINEELQSINTLSFKVKLLLKYNSLNELNKEEVLFLLLNIYFNFLKKRYSLLNDSEVINLIINTITSNKINQVVLTIILKNNLLKKRQKKHKNIIENFNIFLDTELKIIIEKKKFLDNIDKYAYKIFLDKKENKLCKPKNIKIKKKKEFVLKHSNKIKVAVIMDEFSYECFSNEFEAIIITPKNWKEKFENEQPDLFFCESAWSGVDSIIRPWKGKIYTSTNWKTENRIELLEILDYCKKSKIQTIFWNKEDPSHYNDRKHDFVQTAILFDHIFTTAEECVALYKSEYGAKSVYVLPFATAPRLFNPIENKERTNSIVFAGSWYENHKQRSCDMEKILDDILETHQLKIVDRYYGSEDKLHKYPERFTDYIYPSISFNLIPELYKESNIALNFNTVKDSKTMFARRAFELMSSNTLVLSNTSEGMNLLLKDLFIDIEKEPNALKKLSIHDIECIKTKALDHVLKNHTYRHRWNYLLDKIGYKNINHENSVTIISVVNDDSDIIKLIERFKSIDDKNTKLLLILGDEFNEVNIQNYVLEYSKNNIGVISLSFIEKYRIYDDFIETTHFFLMDKSVINVKEVVEKLISHSYYIENRYLSFDDLFKFKIKQNFFVKNVFSVKDNFKEIISSINTNLEKDTYCLNEIIEVV